MGKQAIVKKNNNSDTIKNPMQFFDKFWGVRKTG